MWEGITATGAFKVKLTFPVTSLTWRETSNTFCLMEWHKALLLPGPDWFDHDHRARKLVLSGRRLTRSPPLFQCVAWQLAFCWWRPNKVWHGVTPVHACWKPPTPPSPLLHHPAWAKGRPLHQGGPYVSPHWAKLWLLSWQAIARVRWA